MLATAGRLSTAELVCARGRPSRVGCTAPRRLRRAYWAGRRHARVDRDGRLALREQDIYYEEARDAFQKAVAIEPNSAYAHNNLATMYSLTGDYNSAIGEFKTAISYSPQMASAHYGLGLALMNTKHYRESIPSFRRALALNPSLVDAHNKLELAQKKSRTL